MDNFVEADFYLRDPRALTRSALADMNPCEYGRVTMLTDMACEEYPFGVLEISMEALCKKWHMNALRTFRFLLKLRDDWRLVSRIEGKDGPLRIELSYRCLRKQADGMDGRGQHDPVAQVNALSDEALRVPEYVQAQQAQRDAAADRKAWERYKKEHPQQPDWTETQRDLFMQERQSARRNPQRPSSRLPEVPLLSPSPSTTIPQPGRPPEGKDTNGANVTPETPPVTAASAANVTASQPAQSHGVTSQSPLESETTTSVVEMQNQNNNKDTPRCHTPSGVTSGSVTSPVTLTEQEEKAVVVSLLSDPSKRYYIPETVALTLVEQFGAARCRQQVAWAVDRPAPPPPGTWGGQLRRSIEENWGEPPVLQERRDEAAKQERQRQAEERKRAQASDQASADEAQKAALDALYLELSPEDRVEVDTQARIDLGEVIRRRYDAALVEQRAGRSLNAAQEMALLQFARHCRLIVQKRVGGEDNAATTATTP